MKLKNKLIPIVALSGLTAVVTPLVATGCNANIDKSFGSGLLKGYTPETETITPCTFPTDSFMLEYYLEQIDRNAQILKDDILWTYASTLTDEVNKNIIANYVKYTDFDMDINFERLSPIAEDERLPLAIEITNHVKGTGTENLVVYNIEDAAYMQILDFDFTVNFNILRPVAIKEGEIENDDFFKGMVDFKDTYIWEIRYAFNSGPNEQPIIDIELSGSYKYKNVGTEEAVEVKNYHTHDIAYANFFTESYYSQAFELYHDLILVMPNFAIFDGWSEEFVHSNRIYFASHYLKGSDFRGS